MFSALTTGYLFLGGAGAGALVVLSLLECANAQRRFGRSPVRTLMTPAPALASASATRARLRTAFALPDEFFARAWPLCFVALAVGML